MNAPRPARRMSSRMKNKIQARARPPPIWSSRNCLNQPSDLTGSHSPGPYQMLSLAPEVGLAVRRACTVTWRRCKVQQAGSTGVVQACATLDRP